MAPEGTHLEDSKIRVRFYLCLPPNTGYESLESYHKFDLKHILDKRDAGGGGGLQLF